MVEECSTCGQVKERHGNPPPPNCPECGHTIETEKLSEFDQLELLKKRLDSRPRPWPDFQTGCSVCGMPRSSHDKTTPFVDRRGPVGGAGELNIELFKKELEKIEWTAEGHCAGAGTGSYTAKLWPWLTKQIINAALAAKAPQGALAKEVREALEICAVRSGNEGYWCLLCGASIKWPSEKQQMIHCQDCLLAAPPTPSKLPAPVSDDTIHHGMVLPAEIEAIDDREKTKRALDALDRLCDMWAEDAGRQPEVCQSPSVDAPTPAPGAERLRETLRLRAEELHVERNGSGLPLKGYSDCHRHIFETCTSPKCVDVREALAAAPGDKQ